MPMPEQIVSLWRQRHRRAGGRDGGQSPLATSTETLDRREKPNLQSCVSPKLHPGRASGIIRHVLTVRIRSVFYVWYFGEAHRSLPERTEK